MLDVFEIWAGLVLVSFAIVGVLAQMEQKESDKSDTSLQEDE